MFFDMTHYHSSRSLRLMMLSALLMLAGISSAETYFGFKIGGVPVTSNNLGGLVGDHIKRCDPSKPCYVWYDRFDKIVTLENVKIERTGSDNRAIFNESCEGLIVRLVGKNYLSSESAAPVRLQRNTTLWLVGDSVTIVGGSEDGIYITNHSTLDIVGDAPLTVTATGSSAIEGSDANTRATVNFMCGDVILEGKKGDLVDVNATFNQSYSLFDKPTVTPRCMVTMKPSDNYSQPSVQNSPITLYGTPASLILAPWGATVGGNSIIINNVKVYGSDIIIGNRYVALLTEDYFPDKKFREQLLAKFPQHYITEDDVNQCTSLNLSGKGILSLTGIGYFTALTSLQCQLNNGMGTLDLSANTALSSLNCVGCTLTSLTLGANKNLKTLDCSSNQLSTFDISGCTGLSVLNCANNKLTALSLTTNKNLTRLDCSDNQLPSLNVSKCKALTEIACYNNKFTSLSVTGLPVLKVLNCSNNPLLKTFNCYENPQLSTLSMWGMAKLETFDCHGCALTSLTIPSTSSLRQLTCYQNKISGTAMNSLVQQLYNRSGTTTGQFVVWANADGEQNAITEQQALAAMEKNWNVVDNNGSPIYDFTPTAVPSVPLSTQQPEPQYNLQGQRVNQPQRRGIYIRSGKKVVLK